jgi:hypothetical protein
MSLARPSARFRRYGLPVKEPALPRGDCEADLHRPSETSSFGSDESDASSMRNDDSDTSPVRNDDDSSDEESRMLMLC